MDSLCRAYEEAVGKGDMDPLLLIPMFILDLLCIHPFNDGNGRMSRPADPAVALPGRLYRGQIYQY